MLLVGAGGYVWIVDTATLLNYLKTTPYFLFANYTLSVIPLFILMGALAERGGLARDLFAAANALFGHSRGGMAMSVIGACAAFGAVCGSSVATTATFGRAALPELRRYGYDAGLRDRHHRGRRHARHPHPAQRHPGGLCHQHRAEHRQAVHGGADPRAAGGRLLRHRHLGRGTAAPGPGPGGRPRPARGAAARRCATSIPVLLIALVVVGGIYGGIFTPTESAAIGCIATLVVGLARGTPERPAGAGALLATAETTAMIFVILLGAEVFNAFLALTRRPSCWRSGSPGRTSRPSACSALLLVAYIVLGAVMDELAMILLTLPIFFPVVTALDFGLAGTEETAIWFGILVLIVVGIGLTAPPIGLNVFVVSSLARDVPIGRTYRGVLPFLATDLLRLALCVAFPALSLWLVRLLQLERQAAEAGLGQQVALHQGDADLPQGRQLGRGLDPLGDHLHAELAAGPHHVGDDDAARPVPVAVRAPAPCRA